MRNLLKRLELVNLPTNIDQSENKSIPKEIVTSYYQLIGETLEVYEILKKQLSQCELSAQK